MKILLYFVTQILFLLILIFIYYKYIDKNKEPKVIIFYSTIFSFSIALLEFFLFKPAFGKVYGLYDPYFFAYYIAEERDYFLKFSNQLLIFAFFLISLSKAFCFSIGLYKLYDYLIVWGKKRDFAGKFTDRLFGYLDEPVDYLFYSLVFFTNIGIFRNIIYIRNTSDFTEDKYIGFLYLINYITIAIISAYIWLIREYDNFEPQFYNFKKFLRVEYYNKNKFINNTDLVVAGFIFVLEFVVRLVQYKFGNLFLVIFLFLLVFLIIYFAIRIFGFVNSKNENDIYKNS